MTIPRRSSRRAAMALLLALVPVLLPLSAIAREERGADGSSTSAPAAEGTRAPVDPAGVAEAAADAEGRGGVELFPEPRLFAAPMADPRWPRFAVGYQRYLADVELRNVAAVSFGESFAVVGGPGPFAGRWEVGIQGGVFSVFDLDSASFDLINSDFIGAVTTSYRRGRFSGILRVLHQSSHLGDEYLLRSNVDRINLSFEEVSALVGCDLFDMLRIAFGGGYIVHREPSDLRPGSVQLNLDFVSPYTFASGHLRPIAAVDLQFREETDWSIDRSIVAGLQLEASRASRIRLQGMLEYYGGSSPNGQFYVREIEYVGLALRLVY